MWDALQMHLAQTGELHNNARMGWGKALLRWTSGPQDCMVRHPTLVHGGGTCSSLLQQLTTVLLTATGHIDGSQ